MAFVFTASSLSLFHSFGKGRKEELGDLFYRSVPYIFASAGGQTDEAAVKLVERKKFGFTIYSTYDISVYLKYH